MSDSPSTDATVPSIGFFRGPFQRDIPAPITVRVAFWLIIAATALAAVELVLIVVTSDWAANATAPVILITPLIGGTVGLALRIYISLAILRGYGPARLFFVLVALLTVFGVVSSGFDPIIVIVAVLIVAATVLVWLPGSNRYVDAVTAARKARLNRQAI